VTAVSPQIVNIAAYLFVPLEALPELREKILAQAGDCGLRGTVLLAPEGINLFLAGSRDGIDVFMGWLRTDSRFASLETKESLSDAVPFGKLLVKIKNEIIRMNHPTIRPVAGRAPAVDAHTLHRWLQNGVDDDGREIALLDTRNAFEVDCGTFDGAIDWRIDRFTQFPDAVLAHREELAGKTIVSFCTGGIRCEKAAIYMAEAGIENVYQLDGGILKYLEVTDGRGYHGTCFVFDERRAVDASLAPAPASVA
jgi:UPF0176 protein